MIEATARASAQSMRCRAAPPACDAPPRRRGAKPCGRSLFPACLRADRSEAGAGDCGVGAVYRSNTVDLVGGARCDAPLPSVAKLRSRRDQTVALRQRGRKFSVSQTFENSRNAEIFPAFGDSLARQERRAKRSRPLTSCVAAEIAGTRSRRKFSSPQSLEKSENVEIFAVIAERPVFRTSTGPSRSATASVIPSQFAQSPGNGAATV